MSFTLNVLTEEHGVPPEHVRVLVKWFGAALPDSVEGPADTIKWALGLLPWPDTHPLLRRWFGAAASRGMHLDDPRIQAVFDQCLVDDPDPLLTARIQREVYEVAQRFAAMYGYPTEGDETFSLLAMTSADDANPTMRMWAGALPVTDAAVASCLGLKGDRRMVNAAFGALFCLMEPPGEGVTKEARVDRAVQDVIAALVEHVSTWTGSWK
jgi:hypothetical protein